MALRLRSGRTRVVANDGDAEVLPMEEKKRYSAVVLVTYLNILLYATCFWLQSGVVPYLTKSMDINLVTFGYLQTTFSVAQLVGGLFFGRFGDMFGGQAAFSLAFSSAALCYGLLSVASTVPLLFLSRLSSLFMHVMQAGQMVVTDQTSSSERSVALTHVGISYAIGMGLGPFLGGHIIAFSGEHMAAFVACVGSLVSLAMCVMLIPRHTKTKEPGDKGDADATSLFDMKLLASLFRKKRVSMLLLVKCISGIPIGVFQSMFAMISINTFDLSPTEHGTMMSYIGVITVLTQLVAVGPLAERYKEHSLIKMSTVVLIFAYIMLGVVVNVAQLCLVCIPLVLGMTILSSTVTSALTKSVSDKDTELDMVVIGDDVMPIEECQNCTEYARNQPYTHFFRWDMTWLSVSTHI